VTAGTGGFSRRERLRRSSDFRRLQRAGERIAGPAFIVLVALRAAELWDEAPINARLGVTVSRKVGNAVVRNRVKRRIREWFRSFRCRIGSSVDLVVIARDAAARLSGSEVAAVLTKQVQQSKVLRESALR